MNDSELLPDRALGEAAARQEARAALLLDAADKRDDDVTAALLRSAQVSQMTLLMRQALVSLLMERWRVQDRRVQDALRGEDEGADEVARRERNR